jgi:hypothetical protein
MYLHRSFSMSLHGWLLIWAQWWRLTYAACVQITRDLKVPCFSIFLRNRTSMLEIFVGFGNSLLRGNIKTQHIPFHDACLCTDLCHGAMGSLTRFEEGHSYLGWWSSWQFDGIAFILMFLWTMGWRAMCTPGYVLGIKGLRWSIYHFKE